MTINRNGPRIICAGRLGFSYLNILLVEPGRIELPTS